MATLTKIRRKARKEKLRKEITLWRLKSWKDRKPSTMDIQLGAIVKVNGLGDITGTKLAIDNYRIRPEYFYKFESNIMENKKTSVLK